MHYLFGDENAEKDKLLADCWIALDYNSLVRPILTGRWGTGKSAQLINRNLDLQGALSERDPIKDRIWYITEQTLNINSLFQIKTQFDGDPKLLNAMLQDVWKGEVNRIFCAILAQLHEYYGSPDTFYWKAVKAISATSIASNTLWKNVGQIAGLFLPKDKDEKTEALIGEFQRLVNHETQENILRCLYDIRDDPIQPAVAIEPIETPTSALEDDAGLSQMMISALLNAFQSSFMPDESRAYMRVDIAIPWHRYVPDQLNLPQKLNQHTANIEWKREKLRAFMENRISWEFKRIKRAPIRRSDATYWDTLFEPKVVNQHCDGNVLEGSFDYILRHTQWRARDILQLCRECVIHEADKAGVQPDEIIGGYQGRKISGRTILETLRVQGERIARIRSSEVLRRYGHEGDFFDTLRGINVPFSIDDFVGRYYRHKDRANGSNTAPIRILKILWDAGVVGVEVLAHTEDSYRNLVASHGDSHCRRFPKEGREYSAGAAYFYAYNSHIELVETLERYSELDGGTDANLIVHPIYFEHLHCHVNTTHPVGV